MRVEIGNFYSDIILPVDKSVDWAIQNEVKTVKIGGNDLVGEKK